MATGGDIREITYNNPLVGSGVFYTKADESSTFDTGGYRTTDEDSGLASDGTPIDIMSIVRWSFEGTIVWDMTLPDNELEVLKKLASSTAQTEFTFTSVNGSIWAGTGKPVGDLKGAGKEVTIPVKFSGGGELKRIQ